MRGRNFLTPRETAALFAVTEQTVYRWVYEGKIRAVKAGPEGTKGAVRIPWKAVVKFLAENYQAATLPLSTRRTLADLLEKLSEKSRDPATASALRTLALSLRSLDRIRKKEV